MLTPSEIQQAGAAVSETPRTDALESSFRGSGWSNNRQAQFLASLARQLERELAWNVLQVQTLHEGLHQARRSYEVLATERDQLRAQVAKLREALEIVEMFPKLWAEYWRTSPAYGCGQPENHPTHQAIIDKVAAALSDPAPPVVLLSEAEASSLRGLTHDLISDIDDAIAIDDGEGVRELVVEHGQVLMTSLRFAYRASLCLAYRAKHPRKEAS